MNIMQKNTQQRFVIRISAVLLSAIVLLLMTDIANAQRQKKVVKPDYAQARQYSSQYLRQFVYDSLVQPKWIGETDEFWYSFRTSEGTRYLRVDPKHATKAPLFDHTKLASLLSEMTRQPLDSARLPLTRVEIDEKGESLKFVVDKLQYEFNLDEETLVKLGKAPPEPRRGRRGEIIEEDDDDKEDIKQDDEEQEDVEEKKENEKDVEKKEDGKGKGDSVQKNGKNEKNKQSDVKADSNKDDDEKDGDEKTDDDKVDDKKKAGNEKVNARRRRANANRKVTGKSENKTDKTTEKIDDKQETTQTKRGKETTSQNKNKVDDQMEKSKTDSAADKSEPRKEKPQTDHRAFSPDRTAYVFTKGYDLYFVEIPEGYKYDPKESEATEDKSTEDKSTEDKVQKSEEAKTNTRKSDRKTKTSDETKSDDAKSTGTGKSGKNTKGDARKSAKTNKDDVKKGAEKKDDAKKDDAKKDDAKKDDAKKENTKENAKKNDVDKKDTEEKNTDKKDVQEEKNKDDSKSDDDDSKEDEEEKELPIPDIGPKLDDTAIRLSTDGEEKFSFVGRNRNRFRRGGSTETTEQEEDPEKAKEKKTKPNVTWSKDSVAFFVARSDSRNIKELWVINSLAEPRPTLESYAYSMPGEENVRISHLYYFDRKSKKLTEVEKEWKHESARNVHFRKDGHELRFVRSDRLLRNAKFSKLDPETGKVEVLIEDGFEAANLAQQNVRYLEDSDEMIWWSERSGWGHFYLYDGDGKLVNAITSGEYRASQIVDIDEKNRLMYFQGNGREPNENIYNQHLYCVRLDGTGLTLLDPGAANHRSTLSPTKKFLVDNCSRVDMAPVSVLRDAQGNEILKLEESDLSRLAEIGWKMPETFVVKAADGVTELYGNIWKPFNFDPNRKYPIIAHVYPGPQTEGTSHTFSATAGNQQLAQVGFVVIQVGHRGGTPQRSKAYHNYGYFNLRDYGLADKKAAIEQLAQRFSYIDVERVGIYGHSGGGFMTAAALLQKPYNEFFKVGVSTAGNHDNNIYNSGWSERYHGLKEVTETANKDKEGTAGSRGRTATTRRGAPSVAGDYAAFSVEESDFFYEHEGQINEFGELENSSDHERFDGPEAYLIQDTDKKQVVPEKKVNDQDGDKESDKNTKEKGEEKDETDSKDKSDKEQSEKETRFEIKVPTNAELAANLKGHLFLIHGEADNNVHPANTLRLVDALITQNKRFDMLYLPNTRHGFGKYQPYVTQRMYEYFAEHLLDDYQSAADLGDREE